MPAYALLMVVGINSSTDNIHFIKSTEGSTTNTSVLVSKLVNRSKHLNTVLILFPSLESSYVPCPV